MRHSRRLCGRENTDQHHDATLEVALMAKAKRMMRGPLLTYNPQSAETLITRNIEVHGSSSLVELIFPSLSTNLRLYELITVFILLVFVWRICMAKTSNLVIRAGTKTKIVIRFGWSHLTRASLPLSL